VNIAAVDVSVSVGLESLGSYNSAEMGGFTKQFHSG